MYQFQQRINQERQLLPAEDFIVITKKVISYYTFKSYFIKNFKSSTHPRTQDELYCPTATHIVSILTHSNSGLAFTALGRKAGR